MLTDIKALDRELVKRFGFYEFVKLAFPIVARTEYIDSEHIRVICEYCEDILSGKIKRSVINVPPSSGKSSIISILLPVYAWILDPSLKIISVSYSPELSSSFAYKSLELLNSDWFRARWPEVSINNWKKVAKTDYYNTSGGRRFSTSKGSIFTGVHGDLILLDDLNKASDSKNNFEETVNWCSETLPTRLIDQRNGKMICIAQRLKTYDVCDYFINELNWSTLILPMQYDLEIKDPRDWRIKPGELLTPRIDEESLNNLKLSLGDHQYAQLQQKPVDTTASVFKKDYFKDIYINNFPAFDRLVLSIDSAVYAKTSSDYTVCTLIGKQSKSKRKNIDKDYYYIVSEFRFKLDFAECAEKIHEIYNNLDSPEVIIENKALGAALVSHLRGKIPKIKEISPGTKSKIERAQAVTHLFRNNQIKASFKLSKDWQDELTNFPNSKYDDRVDSITQALIYLDNSVQNFWSVFT